MNDGALRKTLANTLLLGEGILHTISRGITAATSRGTLIETCSPTETRWPESLTRLEAWWLAATNRWLTERMRGCPLPDQTCLLQSLQKTKKSKSICAGPPDFRGAPIAFLWLLGALRNPAETERLTKHKKAGGGNRQPLHNETYLISAFAPASSNFFLASSAAAFGTDSLTGFGAPSTRSFASFRPRPVSSRTALMTETLFAPNSRGSP